MFYKINTTMKPMFVLFLLFLHLSVVLSQLGLSSPGNNLKTFLGRLFPRWASVSKSKFFSRHPRVHRRPAAGPHGDDDQTSTFLANPDDPLPRIFRGWHVMPNEFPWMVKVKAVFPSDARGGHPTRSCGGALIAPSWVLTARHCVTWHPPHLRGVNLNAGGRDRIGAQRVTVFLGGHGQFGEDGHWILAAESIGRRDYGKARCHRGDDDDTCNSIFAMFARKDSVFTNDIALLRLIHPVPLTSSVQPVRLPPLDADYLYSPAFITGWGIHSRDGRSSRTLKAAEMTIIPSWSSSSCRSQDSFGKLCAVTSVHGGVLRKNGGGSACPGDSGSPLVVWDEYNGGWTIVGLLSNGAKSCFSAKPAVYTSVSDYVPWIHDMIDSRENPNRHENTDYDEDIGLQRP